MLDHKEPGSVDSVAAGIIESVKARLAGVSTGVDLALAELRVVVSHAGLLICLLIVAAGMMLVGWGVILVFCALLLMNLGFSGECPDKCVNAHDV